MKYLKTLAAVVAILTGPVAFAAGSMDGMDM